MDRAPDFESVGCEFESRRGRLNVGVYPQLNPTHAGKKASNDTLAFYLLQPYCNPFWRIIGIILYCKG
jgi:hypothetical protein